MIRTAMLPIESINEIKMEQDFFPSLKRFLDEGLMDEAILIASPDLSSMLNKDMLKPKEQRKVADSLFKYISRTFSRATPFGLFASVGTGKFEDIQNIPDFEDLCMQKRSRIDMEWLLGFINQLETDPNIVSQLKVKANHAIRITGKRLELLFPTYCGQGEKIKGNDADTISVRLTAASEYVLEEASNPILFKDLVRKTYEKYDKQIDVSVIFNFVWELFRQEFLISELRPPLLGGDPSKYLLERLDHISGIETEKEMLRQIQNTIKEYDNTSIGKGHLKFNELNKNMQSRISCKSSLQVDTSFQNGITINSSVANSFVEAVEVMWRISSTDCGFPYMKDYYLKFLEKYGTATDVPLLELVNGNTGIGYPAYYANNKSTLSISKEKQVKLGRRRRVLAEQITTSIRNGFSEVNLDQNLIEKLTIREDWQHETPDSMEIYAEIIAPSKDAINQGQYDIVVNPSAGSFQEGLTLGRFADILDEDTNRNMEKMSLKNLELNENILMVDVTYIPTYGRTANIMMSKNFLPYEMAIGTNVQEGKLQVELNDLYVSADNERLFLKSKKYGKEVAIATSNMLNFAGAPNLFRLLKDLSFEKKYYWQPFEWDTGSEQIYLPRLRYKNVVFTPAQWNLNKDMFDEADFKSEEVFFDAFQVIAEKWKIPQYVFLKIADNHILLNLHMKEMVTLVMKDLEKQNMVKIEELIGNFDERNLIAGTNGHYMTEIVFEIEAANRKKRIGKNYKNMKYDITNNILLFPCQEWLYINLYCPENIHNEFLVTEVGPFSEHLISEHLISQWFFIRFEDPKPHIRLRFNLNDTCDSSKLLKQVLEWITGCREKGEIFETSIQPYEREVARYGGPEFMSLAETVFCQDSYTVIKLLDALKICKESQMHSFIGAISAISILQDLGLSRQAQLELLDNYVGKDMYKQEFRTMRNQFLSLMLNKHNSKELMDEQVKAAFLIRQDSLKQYGKKMNECNEMLWNDIFDIASSLLHMNFNRLFGVDREIEKKCLSLARHAIYAFTQYEKHLMKDNK